MMKQAYLDLHCYQKKVKKIVKVLQTVNVLNRLNNVYQEITSATSDFHSLISWLLKILALSQSKLDIVESMYLRRN